MTLMFPKILRGAALSAALAVAALPAAAQDADALTTEDETSASDN